MNCPDMASEVSGNPDKDTRTDKTTPLGNPDICPSGFPSGLGPSVSGFGSAEILSIAKKPRRAVVVFGEAGKATQDGYDWPNNVQDERWPTDKYQPASDYWREQLGRVVWVDPSLDLAHARAFAPQP